MFFRLSQPSPNTTNHSSFDLENYLADANAIAQRRVAALFARDEDARKFLRQGHQKLVEVMKQHLCECPSDSEQALCSFDANKILLIEVAKRMFGDRIASRACFSIGLR